jgi:hypothetical protein
MKKDITCQDSKERRLSFWRPCRNSSLSLRATGRSVAISLFSIRYGIASVVLLPRNDITTQFPGGEGESKGDFTLTSSLKFPINLYRY